MALWVVVGALVSHVCAQGMTDQMSTDVAALTAAARRLHTAWPWQGPLPEVERVARHGSAVAPALVALLRYESDDQYGEPGFSLHVEQQAALALCRIFGLEPESGKTVYGIRSSAWENRTVKRFWQEKVRAVESR